MPFKVKSGKMAGVELIHASLHDHVIGPTLELDAIRFISLERLSHGIRQRIGDGLGMDALAPIPDKPATLYAVATALGMRANAQTFGRISRYAERLRETAAAASRTHAPSSWALRRASIRSRRSRW